MVMAMVCCRLTAGQNLIKGSGLYAYPAGTSFCSCASSRAALHVGSLFLRNRQPSNAPPLLLSPTGRVTRWGPLMQNTLWDTPRPHAPERPLGKPKGGFPKRGLNGAYRVSQTHLPPSPPLPRSGGGDFCSNYCLSQLFISAACLLLLKSSNWYEIDHYPNYLRFLLCMRRLTNPCPRRYNGSKFENEFQI